MVDDEVAAACDLGKSDYSNVPAALGEITKEPITAACDLEQSGCSLALPALDGGVAARKGRRAKPRQGLRCPQGHRLRGWTACGQGWMV